MAKLPRHLAESMKSHDGSKAAVRMLYEQSIDLRKQVSTLEISLKNTQDELENWRTRYHESDKQAGILSAQIKSNLLAEIMKFLIATVLAGVGVNLITDKRYNQGGLLILIAVLCYIGIVLLGKRNDRR